MEAVIEKFHFTSERTELRRGEESLTGQVNKILYLGIRILTHSQMPTLCQHWRFFKKMNEAEFQLKSVSLIPLGLKHESKKVTGELDIHPASE